MKTLCIFIGAHTGNHPHYISVTKQIGEALAKRKIRLVYGGGKIGLMGILADTVLENGGEVTGVITTHLYEREAHHGLTDLIIVDSMQERKKKMTEIADAFMALPGGLGTLEEILALWNAAKLSIHDKPIGMLNINHFFDGLMSFIDHTINEGFLPETARGLITLDYDPDSLIDLLATRQIKIMQENLDAGLTHQLT